MGLVMLGSCDEQISAGDSRKARRIVKKAFDDRFGLKVDHIPLEYSEFANRWVSTLYYDGSLYRVYVLPNGDERADRFQLTFPAGTQKILVAIVNHPELAFEDVIGDTWSEVQDAINAEHQAYAERQAFSTPVVQFENTNVLINPDRITSGSQEELAGILAEDGMDRNEFDILVLLDIDYDVNAGGFASFRGRFVGMGWIYGDQVARELNRENLMGIANAIYHHEIGHVWGWEHEWAIPEGVNAGFITVPVLFGWHDMDGDGVPEILDSNPYGIK